MLQVNVIRSAIDLATTLSENEAQKLLTNTEKSLERLTQNYGAMPQLDAQLNIIKVRLLSSQKGKKAAEKII
jgi:GTP cyclohydrolase II